MGLAAQPTFSHGPPAASTTQRPAARKPAPTAPRASFMPVTATATTATAPTWTRPVAPPVAPVRSAPAPAASDGWNDEDNTTKDLGGGGEWGDGDDLDDLLND
jgi:hypothetical protein